MTRTLFGWPIYSDVGVTYSPSLSGGSWSTTLPLTNLQDRRVHKVARTADDALASTIIKADLGVARSVRLVAGVGHNLSSAAKWRVRGFAASPVLDDSTFSTWSTTGTPVVTTGQSDPFGGTRATLLEDDDGAAAETVIKAVTFTGNGSKGIALSMRAGTSTASDINLRDSSVGADRCRVRATWSGGVPSLSVVSGSGTTYDPVALGGGWYLVQFTADNVVAANTNNYTIYPAGVTNASTGTVYVYEAMAWDLTTQPILHDSGVDDVWPSGIDAEEYENYTKTALEVLSSAVSARYWWVEMADTSNSDGYVQLGRLAICGAWEPTYAASVGAKLGVEDTSVATESDGGATIITERAIRRTAYCTFEHLTKNEAMASAFDMQMQLGTRKQLFVVLDPDDTTNRHRDSFLCRLRELNALEAPVYGRRHVPLALVEEL